MQVFDQSALSTEAKEEMYKLYPNARRAHLKTGGNFPYLCRSAEVNLYTQVSVCIQTGSAAVHSNRKRLFCTGFSPLACLSSAPIADTECRDGSSHIHGGLTLGVHLLPIFSVLLYSKAITSSSQ